MSEYKPDETKTHLMYHIEGRKDSAHDKCFDMVVAKVHSKGECDELIAFLKKQGYFLQVDRSSNMSIMDEDMPGDDKEE
jgi:hypothetical protein